MEEVQNHIGPLRIAVESQGRTLRSLYSNGSGGPPGYLENARREDNERYDRLFRKIENLLMRADNVDDFILKMETVREQREKTDKQKAEEIKNALEIANEKVNQRIGKQNLLIAVAALIVTIFMAVVAYREYTRKSDAAAPPAIHHQQPPADQADGK